MLRCQTKLLLIRVNEKFHKRIRFYEREKLIKHSVLINLSNFIEILKE